MVSIMYSLQWANGKKRTSISSMQGEDLTKFTLYDDAKNCFGIYIVNEYGELLARTIVWDKVKNMFNGIEFMAFSRVYAPSEEFRDILIKECEARGYRNLYELLGHPLHPKENAVKLRVDLGFDLQTGMYEKVPWIDYFQYGYEGLPFLFSYDIEKQKSVKLNDCSGNGGFLTKQELLCPSCGEYLEEDDQIFITPDGIYCEYCCSSGKAEELVSGN